MANKTLNNQEVESISKDLFQAYENHNPLKMEDYATPYDD